MLDMELLNATGDIVAQVLRYDADQSIIVSTFDNDVPLSVIERLPDVAHERCDAFEDGTHLPSSVGWEGPTRRAIQSQASG